jgi:hypothetical protein
MAPQETSEQSRFKWQTLEDGVRLLQVWKLDGPDTYPQVALLRVSIDFYLKYLRDPDSLVGYVNERNVFSKPVICAGPWVGLLSVKGKEYPPKIVITVVHSKRSTMILSAIPDLVEDSM